MSQRKSLSEPTSPPNGSAPHRDREAGEPDKTDFARPDAETAAEGGAPHERATGKAPQDGRTPRENAEDQKHGYSQDAGYPSSGGPPAQASERASRAAARRMRSDGPASSDEEIRSDIHQRLQQEANLRGTKLVIAIGDGIVTLRGEMFSRAEQRRLLDIIHSVPSVREVRNELSVRGAGPPN